MKIYKLQRGWSINLDNKVIFKKSYPIVSWIFTSLRLNKTNVRHLYSMLINEWSAPELNRFLFPLDHDNLPKPKDYPFYFRLKDGWSIDGASIKFLKNGPLFSEDGKDVIVSEKIFIESLTKTAFEFLLGLGSIVAGLKSVYEFIICISDKLKQIHL